MFIVNIHGVGKIPRAYDSGEEPYWIDNVDLESILDFVERHPRPNSIGLSFDDGNRSDHAIAAPALRRRGLRARFFVLAGKLDQDGYLSRGQLRELSEEGFEIGSHGYEHVDWTKANDGILTRELRDSKAIIEDTTGRAVTSAAIPFGIYDRHVLRALRHFGYREIFSSDGGPRLTSAWPTPRYSLRRGVELGALADRIETGAAFLSRAQTEARLRIKASLSRQTLRGLTGLKTLPRAAEHRRT
jgi:peptidoglycan/xylan/chitin deacetylase (PgdA/CDA1 family)